MTKQQKFDNAMMVTAAAFASLSHAKRNKVGCVISKDNRIIANGYNGTLPGLSNECELKCPECEGLGEIDNNISIEPCAKCQGHGNITSEFVLHAEQNAISYCARNGIPLDGTTLYLTLSPCKTCAKLIASCGIERVVYGKVYRDDGGIEYLTKCNIKMEMHNES